MVNVLDYGEFIVACVLGLVWYVLNIQGYTHSHVPAWLGEPAKRCLLKMPHSYVAWLVRMQTWAGRAGNSALADIAFFKILLTLLCLVLWAVLLLPVVLLMASGTFFVPDLVVYLLARRRKKEILDCLPQALDLMVLCVDAGLGLDATLQRVATEATPIAKSLNDELNNLGRDILLGMERQRAYQELYRRTGVDELRTLGAALNQSTKLGLSISKILRNQSEFMRMKQSQKAEERAAKLPIYMSFPLWFCIMPALMTIVLAPSCILFFQQVAFQPGLLK
ncbi:MAG: type II secretion system F family protein [Candidatus Melainabacteria bacterium]|nr:type II secretion system F family protein [Candidatus Melainabacteria bacterium]